MSVFELRNRAVAKVLPENLLKPTLIHILLALDFLHTEAGIIHTGKVSVSFILYYLVLTMGRYTGKKHHAWCRRPVNSVRF